MKQYIALFATVLLLSSCSGTRDGAPGVPVIDLAANIDKDSYGNPDDIFEIKTVIRPEFTDSSMLSSMMNLRGVIGNTIFIEENETLMTFDKTTGKCISSFNKKGNGPGEYRMIHYQWPTADGKGWVVENIVGGNRILAYDLYGNCTMERTDTLCGGIYPCGTGWAVVSEFAEGSNMKIYFYDSAWQLTDTLTTPFVYETLASEEGPVWMTRELTYSDNRLFIENNDTLYSIDRGGLHPEVAFTLGSYALPRFTSFEEMYTNAKNYIRYDSFVIQDYVFVAYNCKGAITIQIYDRNGTLLLSRTSRGEESPGFPVVIDGETYYALPAQYSSGDCIYCGIDEAQLGQRAGTDDINPILLELRLKPR